MVSKNPGVGLKIRYIGDLARHTVCVNNLPSHTALSKNFKELVKISESGIIK